jgi:hypothetical protein
MNVLAFLFSLLLICACSFSLSMRTQQLSELIDRTYQAHHRVSQSILNSYESLCYKQIPKKRSEPSSKKQNHRSHQKRTHNRECARLNLWPLVREGKERHPVLYQTAAQLLRNLYGEALFSDQGQYEVVLLNALMTAAQMELTKHPDLLFLSIEKLRLPQCSLLYYQMLKGTKRVSGESGYPSLLEFLSLDKRASRICIHHASEPLLTACFGSCIAHQLMEQEEPLQRDEFRELCARKGRRFSEEFFDLFDLHKSSHRTTDSQKIVVHDENEVLLRKKLFFAS